MIMRTILAPLLVLLVTSLSVAPCAAQEFLTCGATVSGALASRETASFQVRLAEGESISIESLDLSVADGGELFVEVIDPFGESIDGFCGIGLDLLEADAGVHTIEVSACNSASRTSSADATSNPPRTRMVQRIWHTRKSGRPRLAQVCLGVRGVFSAAMTSHSSGPAPMASRTDR